MSIEKNIQIVQEKIEKCCNKAGVDKNSVELICVSKTVDSDAVLSAYNFGMRSFGENRVQEFINKNEKLPNDIRWNLIGRLQTNKVKYIINRGVFLLHALDRQELAKELQKQCEKQDTVLDALIQVNISREDTKAGVYEEDLQMFLDQMVVYDRVRLKGIMTIGPNTSDENSIRSVFAKAKQIFDKFSTEVSGFEYLSMGMTNDFEIAIEMGSNMVRVGTAIFGERQI